MKEYIYITDIQQITPYLPSLKSAEIIALDTETTGLDSHTCTIRLLQIAIENMPVLVIDFFKLNSNDLTIINDILATSSIKVLQNAKFDIQFLKSSGLTLKGNIFDTMIAAQLLRTSEGSKSAGLGKIAKHYLDIDLPKDEQVSDWNGKLRAEQLLYAARDASILLKLRTAMLPLLKANHLIEVARLEFACVRAIAQIEYKGINLHIEKWNLLLNKTKKDKENALELLYPYMEKPQIQMNLFGDNEEIGMNLDSTNQVLELLNNNGIPVEDTSSQTLSDYKLHPIVQGLFQYRKATKALSGFLNTIPKHINPKTKRLHPSYRQIGAHSGRMSCGNPNIQQIPRNKAFRECFTAQKGNKLIIADYSQVELRVIAEISKDQRMIDAYKKGEDLHKLTASLVLEKNIKAITKDERQAAKAINFGLVFAMGANGLQRYSQDTYGVKMTIDEAHLFRERYFNAYTGVARWHKEIKNFPPNQSRTLAGRKHIYSENSGLASLYNTPIQGSAADILKNALGMLFNELDGTGAYMIGVIHDEIILECPEENADNVANILTITMKQAGNKYINSIPIVVDVSISNTWAGK